jgi:hypothetical protein
MLPDFPDVKRLVSKAMARATAQEVGVAEPLLREIRHQRVHEGRAATLTRADASTDRFDFRVATAEVVVPAEQMRHVTPAQLLEQVRTVARQFAEQQSRHMFETLTRVIEASGNVVAVGADGGKAAFLEMERRRETDFDPKTLEPSAPTLVLHPTQIESFKAQFEEWHRDPEFVAERERIRYIKLEEWRAREDRRKLVD